MSDSPGAFGSEQPSDQPFGNYQPPGQQPGFGQEPTQAATPGPGSALEPQLPGEPVLVSIGDISITQSQVFTPSGVRQLSEVQWSVTDMTVTNQGIPTWAIVCAVVFFLACFLGLLFLLVKETTTKGSMQVTVHGPGFVHTSQIPVFNQAQVADINSRVNYVRTLTASGGIPQPFQPGQFAPGQQFQQGQIPGQGQFPGQGQQPGQQPGQSW